MTNPNPNQNPYPINMNAPHHQEGAYIGRATQPIAYRIEMDNTQAIKQISAPIQYPNMPYNPSQPYTGSPQAAPLVPIYSPVAANPPPLQSPESAITEQTYTHIDNTQDNQKQIKPKNKKMAKPSSPHKNKQNKQNQQNQEENKNILSRGLGKVKDGVSYVKDKVSKGLDDVSSKAKEQAFRVKQEALNYRIGQEIEKGFSALDRNVHQVLDSVKDRIEAWCKQQIEKNLKNILRKAPPHIKRKLKDPEMCNCLEELVDDLVDDIWPEIEEEIISALRYKFDTIEEFKPIPDPPRCLPCICCIKIRNWALYRLNPVDRTIWAQIKWPSYWFLNAISLFPFYCVPQVLYFLFFLMINKKDEYQIIKFIMQVKKNQFVSAGIFKGWIGFILYYNCVNFGTEGNEHKCEDYGPGFGTLYLIEVISYLLMILLTWIACFFLFCAQKTGQPKFRFLKDSEEENTKRNRKKSCLCRCCFKSDEVRGGRLWCFLIYDMVIVLICCIIFLGIIRIAHLELPDWKMKADIYWCHFVYGIFSLPFVIFAIPIFEMLITKARETGYDKKGRLLPKYICKKEYIKKYGNSLNLKICPKEVEGEEEEELIKIESFENKIKED